MSVNVHSPAETANFEPAVAGLIFRTVAAPEEFDPTTVTGLSGSFTAKFSVMSERRITLLMDDSIYLFDRIIYCQRDRACTGWSDSTSGPKIDRLWMIDEGGYDR